MTGKELYDWWVQRLSTIAQPPIMGWPAIYLACRELHLTRIGGREYTFTSWQSIMRGSPVRPYWRVPGNVPRVFTTRGILIAWAIAGGHRWKVRPRKYRVAWPGPRFLST